LAVEVMMLTGVVCGNADGVIGTTAGGMTLVLLVLVGSVEGVLDSMLYIVVEPIVLTIVLNPAPVPEATTALVDVIMESCCPTLLVTTFAREVNVLYRTMVSVEMKVEREVLNAFAAAETVAVERSGCVAMGTEETAFAAAMQAAR
jgi:hypothetical protein